MGRIHRLSPLEAQKIAAGQVVERPVNVVKELVENAYDAGATEILIELEDAGKKRIHIVDNGCGMSADDARLSIEKHATSKITALEDLAHITTFGFRGEALASIAAVSRMKLTTKHIDDPYAIELTIADGQIQHETMCAHNTGTSIEICDLFYNMPARQKFLKKRETEWNQIHHFLQAFCLSHRDVTLTVYQNGQRSVHHPAVASLRDRCAQVWSSAVVPELLDLTSHHEKSIVSIAGVVSNHQHARYDRSGIFVFVNNRWIQNTALTRAVLKAYQNVLPAGRYPIGSLFITIDQREIDINIHPKKEEISFLHPRMIEQVVSESVTHALESKLTDIIKKPVQLTAGLLPDGTIQRMHYHVPYQTVARDIVSIQSVSAVEYQSDNNKNRDQSTSANKQFHDWFVNFVPPAEPFRQEEKPSIQAELPTLEQSFQIVGQYARTYILVEHPEGLWMIDQHAAYERILYESLVNGQAKSVTVSLIVPQIITLAHDQLIQLEPHLALLRTTGFEVAVYGRDQLCISSTPVYAKNIALDELVRQLVSWIQEYQTYTAQEFEAVIQHHMRAQIACKTAVKAGDELSHKEMVELLEKLEKTPNKLTCPHGRPTGWLLSLYEIEKKFKRKV